MSSQHSSSSTAVDKEKLLTVYRQAILENLPLSDLDVKLNSMIKRKEMKKKFDQEHDRAYQHKLWEKLPKLVRMTAASIPIIFMLVGIVMAGSVLWPIFSHYLPSMNNSQSDLLSPMSVSQWEEVNADQVFASETIIDENNQQVVLSEPIISNESLDYTDLNNWFMNDSPLDQVEEQIEEYSLDIPKLEIKNAVVKVGGTDLNKSLIQYPDTALPGQPGATVVFGHSTLRQFYSPSEKNSKRYSSIFSTIMTLREGDEIYLTYQNVKYSYRVLSNHEVKPTDTFILSQRYDARQLKLITCVPEGTTLRRGVVVAELVRGKK